MLTLHILCLLAVCWYNRLSWPQRDIGGQSMAWKCSLHLCLVVAAAGSAWESRCTSPQKGFSASFSEIPRCSQDRWDTVPPVRFGSASGSPVCSCDSCLLLQNLSSGVRSQILYPCLSEAGRLKVWSASRMLLCISSDVHKGGGGQLLKNAH